MKRAITGILAIILLLFATVGEVDARYCNNPYCAMCNRIFGYMPGYGPKRTVTVTAPKADPIPEFDPTPQPVVEVMLALVQPKEGEVMYDLGSGDGRIVISAAKYYKCQAFGVEIEPKIADLARKKIKEAGVEAKIIDGDATKHNVGGADIITMYLFPDAMPTNLKDVLRPGTRVISLEHKIPGVDAKATTAYIGGKKYTFYIWTAT